MNNTERAELLDWVSACQSAYHIDNTEGHRFAMCGSNLQENRDGLVGFVEGLISQYAALPPESPLAMSMFANRADYDAALASLPSERPEAEDAIPAGWVFNSADFSMLATGSGTEGSVMLKRDKAGTAAWHELSEAERETKSLYVYGKGKTIAEAIRAAALAASQGAKE